jgi:hypothetical protein
MTGPAWAEAEPCSCWSCDRQCGGTVDPLSCGPTVERDGYTLCVSCQTQTAVFDTERRGVGVAPVPGEPVVLVDADVFSYRAPRLRLTVRSARTLADNLRAAADLAERSAESYAAQADQ